MAALLRSVLLGGAWLGFSLAAHAQNVATSALGLRPTAGSSQRTVGLDDSKSRIIQVLGPPTKTSRFYAEIDKKWWPVLHYGSNKLYFDGDRLVIAELSDSRLTVGKPGTTGVRVGAVLPRATPATTKQPLAFGSFSVERKPGRSHNLSYSAISYGNMKTPKGQVLDVAYEILYDQQGRVTHIFLDQTYD